MGKALYRKYRPKKLSEIVGQEHITTTLNNALTSGKISHAYLFSGPRGVGKTSIARILAHELNHLPYDEEATHLDIIEIDAASNRRIDEIRDLRERVHNAPASAKFKVYIIDEVHMLTREAFNALLKTLEEPPEHAIFILATTEAHKLPETIISRTQRYNFRPIDPQKVVAHLKTIGKQEKISITDDALALIARHGEGSFRDSISLLDQVRNLSSKISLEAVQQTLGIAPAEAIEALIKALASHDAKQVLAELLAMQQQGYHAPQIAKQLSAALRQMLIDEADQLPLSLTAATELLRQLLNVPASPDPARLLEIVLLEATLAESVNIEKLAAIVTPNPVTATRSEPSALKTTPASDTPQKIKTNPSNNQSRSPETSPDSLDDQVWQKILQAIKAKHNTLYSVARMATPSFSDHTVTLAFSFQFHQKRLDDPKNKQVIMDIIQEIVGYPVRVDCVVDATARTMPVAISQPATDHRLENISNIFGGGEVLE